MTGAGSTSTTSRTRPSELGISEGPRKGQTVTLRQVTRLVPAKGGGTRQIHALTSRDDLAAGEVCWRLSSRWREENYFRYARTRFALDALDSYAAAPDDPDRMVPNPARKTAAARVRQAEAAAQAAEAARDAALLQLRSPAPGQAAYLTNQVINALAAPVEAACLELEQAEQAAAAVPARVPLGTLAPDMVRLDAETKQITHAIRMAAYNAETALARALDGHYARAGDEAYALIREALTVSGDICPGPGELLIRLDPLTAPRRTQALAALCDQLTAAGARYPGTDLVLRYEVKSPQALHKRSPYVGSPEGPRGVAQETAWVHVGPAADASRVGHAGQPGYLHRARVEPVDQQEQGSQPGAQPAHRPPSCRDRPAVGEQQQQEHEQAGWEHQCQRPVDEPRCPHPRGGTGRSGQRMQRVLSGHRAARQQHANAEQEPADRVARPARRHDRTARRVRDQEPVRAETGSDITQVPVARGQDPRRGKAGEAHRPDRPGRRGGRTRYNAGSITVGDRGHRLSRCWRPCGLPPGPDEQKLLRWRSGIVTGNRFRTRQVIQAVRAEAARARA